MKTSRHPKSREHLQRVILRMADSAVGLTWRRLHDAVATDDRMRAREALYGLALRGQLHQRHVKRQTYFFASAALAAAWVPPPDFNAPRSVVLRPPQQERKQACVPIFTRGPSYTHDPRYQVGAGDKVPALFSALPVGRYLDE